MIGEKLLEAAGNAAPAANYIEDVFSTYLYTGNGSTQTITNNIDLSTKGGLIWTKSRGTVDGHALVDTARGGTNVLQSQSSGAESALAATTFNIDGYYLGNANGRLNASSYNYVSWTFRKQPKFFDVVTYTGNGTSSQSISHSLGVTPAFIIIKKTSATDNWKTFARVSDTTWTLAYLNLTNAGSNFAYSAISPALSSTTVNTGYISTNIESGCNDSGATYVMYMFAHNAGGFGLTGTDNVISCGSFTTDSSGNASVNLGWEPQWVLTKMSTAATQWVINDNMRGMPASQTSQVLYPSLSAAESSSIYYTTQPNATGFTTNAYANQPNNTVIYIAIRRGPMKVPTDATKVFAPTATAVTTGTKVTTGFVTDLQMANYRSGAASNTVFTDRLRGISNTSAASPTLGSANTNAEINTIDYLYAADNTGWKQGSFSSGGNSIRYDFQRAPSFFDEVCDTGTGSAHAITHNLGVTPELIIRKTRSDTGRGWPVYAQSLGATKYVYLDQNYAEDTWSVIWNNTAPTSTQFTVGTSQITNNSGATYVTYLFATCPGVSKVGSYTGNGTTQTINCGFAGGARFVLIKRTDSTGDWYVYDTARGMTTLVDPYLLLNSTAAESATLGSVTTVTTGFAVNASILAAINTNGASYIFLAIA